MYCIPTAYRAVQTRDSRMDTAWELAGKETVFCLAQVPLTCTGVPDDILNPKNQWSNKGRVRQDSRAPGRPVPGKLDVLCMWTSIKNASGLCVATPPPISECCISI